MIDTGGGRPGVMPAAGPEAVGAEEVRLMEAEAHTARLLLYFLLYFTTNLQLPRLAGRVREREGETP